MGRAKGTPYLIPPNTQFQNRGGHESHMKGSPSALHASEKKYDLGSHWQSDEFLSNRKTEAGKF